LSILEVDSNRLQAFPQKTTNGKLVAAIDAWTFRACASGFSVFRDEKKYITSHNPKVFLTAI
jgi:hypothetical protein